jgi:hypothetical protein
MSSPPDLVDDSSSETEEVSLPLPVSEDSETEGESIGSDDTLSENLDEDEYDYEDSFLESSGESVEELTSIREDVDDDSNILLEEDDESDDEKPDARGVARLARMVKKYEKMHQQS